MLPSNRASASGFSSDRSVIDFTRLPFSPHKGQIASFSIRPFTDGDAAGRSNEQQSDIGSFARLPRADRWCGSAHQERVIESNSLIVLHTNKLSTASSLIYPGPDALGRHAPTCLPPQSDR